MPSNITPPWYQTTIGRVFLGVLIAVLILITVFGSLIIYYFWKIKAGGGAELAQTFDRQFTLDPAKAALKATNQITKDARLFIRAENPQLGESSAPVTILAFIDFECPFCQESYPIFQEVVERYGPAVRVVFKHLPVPQLHPHATSAHLAAACAQEQNKFWPYYDQLFTNKLLTDASLLDEAKTLALDVNRFQSCWRAKKYEKDILQDLLDGAELGIRGTPTYIVNQTKLEGVAPKEVWDTVIINELKK